LGHQADLANATPPLIGVGRQASAIANGELAAPRWTNPAWKVDGDQGYADFGISTATAGDVNGDGYDDVIVGADGYDNGQIRGGRAFLYEGSASGPSRTPDWTSDSDQESAGFGRSVALAGDVNGDGFDDVVVGAWLYDNDQTDEGRALVYHGSASGLSSTPDWIAESNQTYAYFGYSVATAGDVNGDGYDDVIVGSFGYVNGQSSEGGAFVYHGSASGLSTVPNWTAESNQSGASFGYSVGTAGDVNGDGYDDVIAGAYNYDNVGGAFVYHGSPTGLSTAPDWTSESNQFFSSFGVSVGTAGDVNGDGYGDVIVGAGDYDHGQTSEGRAFVYHGSVTGLSTVPNWTAESNQARAIFGYSVGTAGDVNGDGYDDVIVGAFGYDNGQTDEGRAFFCRGSAAGLCSAPDGTAESDQASANFGSPVGTAGDVNGDGYGDALVGASGYDHGQSNEGAVFIYGGRPG
jgi:hypothetical protein